MGLKLYSPDFLVKLSDVSLHARRHTLVLERFISGSPVLPLAFLCILQIISHVGAELDLVTSQHKHHMSVTVAAFQPSLPLN